MRIATRYFFFVLLSVLQVGLLSAKTYIHKPSAVGTDFYIAFPKAAYGNQNVEAIVNSPVRQRIHITAAGFNGGGGYKSIPINKYQDIEQGIFHI
ncbi:MAG TPA: hypothetical protein VFA55_06865, partial [Candidatus Kapabacteria bacterium]|nr:hypothetical protein [Candidatus Kapabacteria bacterium]